MNEDSLGAEDIRALLLHVTDYAVDLALKDPDSRLWPSDGGPPFTIAETRGIAAESHAYISALPVDEPRLVQLGSLGLSLQQLLDTLPDEGPWPMPGDDLLSYLVLHVRKAGLLD